MSFDANWARWIVASIHKSIETQNGGSAPPSGKYFLYYEGATRKTNKVDSYVEIRLDGPHFEEQSKDYWRTEVELDLLQSCQQDNDLYHIDRMLGDCAAWLQSDIGIFKLGDGPQDDQSLLGCMRRDEPGGIATHKFGLIQPKLPLIQASVAAKFWLALP